MYLANVNFGLQAVTMDWELGQFLVNLKDTVKTWGSGFIMLFGVVMIIFGAYQICKGFIGGGRAQISWGMTIGCLLIGGCFLAGGWNLMSNISKGAGNSIQNIGESGNGKNLSLDGEGQDKKSSKSTQTIVLPFSSVDAHIDMK